MITVDELLNVLVSHNPAAHTALVRQAYAFAQHAHEGQKRDSGAPYFEHPVEVAMILARIRLDTTSVVAALLHDTVEDTSVTLDEVRESFGDEVAFLVHSVTKLSRVSWQAEQGMRVSLFHKLLIGMARDMRALLIKLADRLHNMRTLHYVPSVPKQRRIARETLDMYAPLAERIGIQNFKDEMEDIATRVLCPELYQAIVHKMAEVTCVDHTHIDKICQDIENVLNQHHISASVSGRTKTPHSVIKKMERKHLTFEQLADLLAFRVIVHTKAECYQALGILHEAYVVLPGRFKDYISIPKANGYQSLHTGLIGPLQQKIEVQIRTRDMDDIATYGVAAHWWHKNPDQLAPPQEYTWLRNLLETIEHSDNPEEVMEQSCLEVSLQDVYCFTPKNRLVILPAGSTCIDFAYAVHTWVGDHCISAKINSREMPLRTQLANGDVIEIITSETATTSPEWVRFAMTSHARLRIRRIGRAQKKAQHTLLGRTIFEKALERKKLSYVEDDVKTHLESLSCSTLDDLWAKIGQGLIPVWDVLAQTHPNMTWKAKLQKRFYKAESHAGMHGPASAAVPLTGLVPGLAIRYAECCYPLPGDRISGIMVSGKGVTVHREDCAIIDRYTHHTEKVLHLSWKKQDVHDQRFIGRVSTRMLNQPGYLAAIAHIIGQNNANIINLKITKKTTEFFDFVIDMELSSVEHLKNIIALLKTHKAVCAVERL